MYSFAIVTRFVQTESDPLHLGEALLEFAKCGRFTPKSCRHGSRDVVPILRTAKDWETLRACQMAPQQSSTMPAVDDFAEMLSHLVSGANVEVTKPDILQELPFTVTELDSAISSLKSNKAGDECGLATEPLHHAPPAFSWGIVRSFQLCFLLRAMFHLPCRKRCARCWLKSAKSKLVTDYRPSNTSWPGPNSGGRYSLGKQLALLLSVRVPVFPHGGGVRTAYSLGEKARMAQGLFMFHSMFANGTVRRADFCFFEYSVFLHGHVLSMSTDAWRKMLAARSLFLPLPPALSICLPPSLSVHLSTPLSQSQSQSLSLSLSLSLLSLSLSISVFLYLYLFLCLCLYLYLLFLRVQGGNHVEGTPDEPSPPHPPTPNNIEGFPGPHTPPYILVEGEGMPVRARSTRS